MAGGSSGSEPGEPLFPPTQCPGMASKPGPTGGRQENSGRTHALLLELEGRRISSGFYDNDTGRLRSLVVETLGGEREVAGNHNPYEVHRTLIESPPSVEPPLQLTHLTGDQETKNWFVVFHYE